MIIQYLVGLCCLSHDPDAVDITVGDMVFDTAAGKERDVDVTVTIQEGNGTVIAFKASEVKHEGQALDVGTIEQLCLKLADMPKVTHKSIFSSSGYTDGAIAKATAHSVELYSLKTWDKSIEEDFPDFQGVRTPSEFLAHFQTSLLYWTDYRIFIIAPEGPSSFTYKVNSPAFAKNGKRHAVFSNMEQFENEILMRSTGILCTQEPATTILNSFPYGMVIENADYLAGPDWGHTHTLDVTRDQVYLQTEDRSPFLVDSVTISGKLQWRRRKRELQFFVLERVRDSAIFAGAAVADYGTNDGRMFAMIFPEKGRTLGIHQFQIPEKQKNMIRNLKIKLSS